MEKTEDSTSISIDQGQYKFTIVAPADLIPKNQPEPHAGEWEARVTIYRISNSEPPKAQSFHGFPQYGATEEEARSNGYEYGKQLVLGTIEGLKFDVTMEQKT